VISNLLKRLFVLAYLLFNLVFVVGILEVVGMMFYLAMTEQRPAFARLREAGFTPENVLEFLLANPDRLAVAGGLAVVGTVLVLAGGSGRAVLDDDVDFDGDFGDGGGDGGGGGGE